LWLIVKTISLQFNEVFSGRSASAGSMICIEKRNVLNVITVSSFVFLIVAVVVVLILIVIALLIILCIWLKRKCNGKTVAKIAPALVGVGAAAVIVSLLTTTAT
jgi:hypothetical protein